MLFGANTMTFYTHPIVDAIRNLAECGFDCVEIWIDHLQDGVNGATRAKISEIIAKYGLKTTVHCPIMDINIASPNGGIRAESLRQVMEAIDITSELNSELIVVHPGHKYSSREANHIHWSYQVESVTEILNYGESKNVMVALENMDRGQARISVQHWDDLKKLFDDCGSKNKYVTLDTTHLRETGAVLDFIRQAQNNIVHLHLSDGTLESMHLPLGEGNLDLATIAAELLKINYGGICSLECFIPGDKGLLREQLLKAKALFQAPR